MGSGQPWGTEQGTGHARVLKEMGAGGVGQGCEAGSLRSPLISTTENGNSAAPEIPTRGSQTRGRARGSPPGLEGPCWGRSPPRDLCSSGTSEQTPTPFLQETNPGQRRNQVGRGQSPGLDGDKSGPRQKALVGGGRSCWHPWEEPESRTGEA